MAIEVMLVSGKKFIYLRLEKEVLHWKQYSWPYRTSSLQTTHASWAYLARRGTFWQAKTGLPSQLSG